MLEQAFPVEAVTCGEAYASTCSPNRTCEKPKLEQASSEGLQPVERAHTEAGEKLEGAGAAERN